MKGFSPQVQEELNAKGSVEVDLTESFGDIKDLFAQVLVRFNRDVLAKDDKAYMKDITFDGYVCNGDKIALTDATIGLAQIRDGDGKLIDLHDVPVELGFNVGKDGKIIISSASIPSNSPDLPAELEGIAGSSAWMTRKMFTDKLKSLEFTVVFILRYFMNLEFVQKIFFRIDKGHVYLKATKQ